MKKSLAILFCCCVGLLTATYAQTDPPCGMDNPATDLPWLAERVADLCEPFSCVTSIEQAWYNGQWVFISNGNNPMCADFPIEIFTCEGDLLCFFGGFIGGTGEGCPDFFDLVANRQVLASSGGCCPTLPPIASLPVDALCTNGMIPVPEPIALGIGLPLPVPAAWGILVVNQDGEIVLPVGSYSEIDFLSVPGGTYCVRGIAYDPDDPYDMSATTVDELLGGGGCFVLQDCGESNTIDVGGNIPWATVSTEPQCVSDTSYTVGFTVTNTFDGTAWYNGNLVNEGEEFFLTFTDEYYEVDIPVDNATGCMNDYIEVFGPVDCGGFGCIDSSQITGNGCYETYDPVCGCNGITYPNDCYAFEAGVVSWIPGECAASGCIDPALITNGPCPYVYAPVCGCNGITYYNQCDAETWGGVTSWLPGECAASGCIDSTLITQGPCIEIYDPVCGCDGITYDNACFAETWGGVSSWLPGECTVSSECIDSSLINYLGCPDIWDPVCGCNGVTYGNGCEALNWHGVAFFHSGVCQTDTVLLCPGDSVQIGVVQLPNELYRWVPATGLGCEFCPVAYANPSADTTLYRLEVSPTVPLPVQPTYHFFLVIRDDCTGVGKPATQADEIELYPNPVGDALFVRLPDGLQATGIRICNALGQSVAQPSLSGGGQIGLDVGHLPTGVYFVEVQTPQGRLVKRFGKR